MTSGDILFHATTKTQPKMETNRTVLALTSGIILTCCLLWKNVKLRQHTTTFAHHKNPEVYYGERGSG